MKTLPNVLLLALSCIDAQRFGKRTTQLNNGLMLDERVYKLEAPDNNFQSLTASPI